MSNYYNEMILERLYDEAYEELKPIHSIIMQRYHLDEQDLHEAAVELAQKRWENYP